MASKVVVMKGGNFDAQVSAEKLAGELEALRRQFVEVAGEKDNDGVTFPANDFTVNPETKADIIRNVKYLTGVFMADKKMSNTGREPKADLSSLQRVYIDYIREHRTQNRELAAMSVALKYNNDKPENLHITGSYVTRAAKKNNWDALIDAPETEPAMA